MRVTKVLTYLTTAFHLGFGQRVPVQGIKVQLAALAPDDDLCAIWLDGDSLAVCCSAIMWTRNAMGAPVLRS